MTPVLAIFSPLNEIDTLVHGGTTVRAPLTDWLTHEGIMTVDVTDDLLEEARRVGAEHIVDAHDSPLGNEIIARTLAQRLPELVRGTCGD